MKLGFGSPSDLKAVAHRARDAAERSAKQAVEGAAELAAGGKRVLTRSLARSERIWKPESPGLALEASPLLAEPPPLPEDYSALVAVRWRSEALLGLSAAGLVSLEDEIIGVTRALFHDELPHRAVSRRLFGADFGEVHRWIDTVPGRSHAGGGPEHRVLHGHDLEAAAALYGEQGLAGLFGWLQHVGQDRMTPTGVPLPLGARNIVEQLVERGLLPPRRAALLVSLNAVELASLVLGSRFLAGLIGLLQEWRRQKELRDRCAAAARAREAGDLDAVIANLGAAHSLSDHDPAFALALGWAYAESGRPRAESFLYFRRAARELATADRTIDLGGLLISLRGCAYLLALSQADAVLQGEGTRAAWRDELEEMIRGAVAAFEITALHLIDKRSIPFMPGQRWRARPLAAAANYYLAARVTYAIPFLELGGEGERLTDMALELIRCSGEIYSNHAEPLHRVGETWRAQLAPVPV